MNILKRILLIIAIFTSIIVIISLFLPSSFKMEKRTLIDADKEQVFKQVNDLKNWINWSAWALKDKSVYLKDDNYSNPSAGVGAMFSWQSEKDEIGEGKLKIVQSDKYDHIETLVDIGFVPIKDDWYFNQTPEGVEVIWQTQIDFGFNPLSKFYGLFIEEEMAPDYKLGLERLKEYTENLPKIHSVKVKKDSVSETWFLSIRDSVHATEMDNVHGKMYAKINRFMDSNNVEISGSPLVVYHFWSDTLIDMEAGIPIKDSMYIVNNGKIKLNKIEAGNVVTAIHYGHYDRLPETYFGINEWMRKNKVVVRGPLWEVYITDPATESDTKKWQTAIYFPIN